MLLRHCANSACFRDRRLSSTGLTLGDLRDAAEQLLPKHRLCPFANVHRHDPRSGQVYAPVCFEGTMTLAHDDPALLADRVGHPGKLISAASFKYSHAYESLDSSKKDQLERYFVAKREGNIRVSLKSLLTAANQF